MTFNLAASQPMLVASATVNLAQTAATYNLFRASGDVLIDRFSFYGIAAGVGLVSVAVQTNQAAPFVILSAGDGVLANLLLGKTIATTWTQAQPFTLRDGQQIQYTIVGIGSAGSLLASTTYYPISVGAGVLEVSS